jgi:hypothetical protein
LKQRNTMKLVTLSTIVVMKCNLLISAMLVMKKWIATFVDLTIQRHTIADLRKGVEDNGRYLY